MKSAIRPGSDGGPQRAVRASAPIRVDARYDVAPARVFDAWLEPEIANKWLFATATRRCARVAIDARVTGAFRFVEAREHGGVEHFGRYVELVASRRLAFNLARSDRPRAATRVVVGIEQCGRGCKLSLVHEDVPLDLITVTETRWIGMLYGLGATLGSVARDRQSTPQSLATEIVLPRLVPVRAAASAITQPSTHPRSH